MMSTRISKKKQGRSTRGSVPPTEPAETTGKLLRRTIKQEGAGTTQPAENTPRASGSKSIQLTKRG